MNHEDINYLLDEYSLMSVNSKDWLQQADLNWIHRANINMANRNIVKKIKEILDNKSVCVHDLLDLMKYRAAANDATLLFDYAHIDIVSMNNKNLNALGQLVEEFFLDHNAVIDMSGFRQVFKDPRKDYLGSIERCNEVNFYDYIIKKIREKMEEACTT